ncbi:unnamed protein product [marine sediment metagenome]|uniref:Uncharacterized protein n=1 Tax=marine sediment metagenome TaxID=412755 RepID=X1CK81_9ZZZZ
MARSKDTMEYIRGTVTESAAGAATVAEIDMPVRFDANLAVLIHKIVFRGGYFDAGHAQGDYFRCALHKIGSVQNPGDINDEYVIACLHQTLSVDATPNIIILEEGLMEWTFDPPLLYAKDNVYLAVLSAGQASALTAHVLIMYTLEKVTDDVFIDALTD